MDKKELTVHKVKNLSLDEILILLSAYGKPRVGVYGEDNLWRASLDLHVQSAGASFSTGSEYNHPTPLDAVRCLVERLENVFKQYR